MPAQGSRPGWQIYSCCKAQVLTGGALRAHSTVHEADNSCLRALRKDKPRDWMCTLQWIWKQYPLQYCCYSFGGAGGGRFTVDFDLCNQYPHPHSTVQNFPSFAVEGRKMHCRLNFCCLKFGTQLDSHEF